MSSGLAALGGILLVSRLSIASPSMANAYELQAIAAAVVGGASLFGGRGTVLGAVVGAVLFTTMSNAAVLLGVDPFWEMVLEGLADRARGLPRQPAEDGDSPAPDSAGRRCRNALHRTADRIMQAVVCRKPGELALEERPEPERGEDEVLRRHPPHRNLRHRLPHLSRAVIPIWSIRAIMGHELSGEVLEAPHGQCRCKRGQIVVVNPYVSCGRCIACRNGKPNCCVRIAVLGVHRDGGMCERISVPERNLYPAGRPHRRSGGQRRVPGDRRPCRRPLSVSATAPARW